MPDECSLDPLDEDGHTPLADALWNDKDDCALTLLEAGALLSLVPESVTVPQWAVEFPLRRAVMGASVDSTAAV